MRKPKVYSDGIERDVVFTEHRNDGNFDIYKDEEGQAYKTQFGSPQFPLNTTVSIKFCRRYSDGSLFILGGRH